MPPDAPASRRPGRPARVGRRLLAARRARGLSRAALAGPELSAAFVRAVETGRHLPSRRAAGLLATRLGLDPAALPNPPAHPAAAPDLAALDEDVQYQLAVAKGLMNAAGGDAARAVLDAAVAPAGPDLAALPLATRYRYHRLRGLTFLRDRAPAAAGPDLARAFALAAALGDAQEVERVRNALGAAAYEQDLPARARRLHEEGVHAITAGRVKDLNLQVVIYSNLANACWALGDYTQAIAAYHEARALLDDVNNPERRGGIYWGLAQCHRARGELVRARLYAAEALRLYTAAGAPAEQAIAHMNLGEILIAEGDLAGAETELAAAEALLDATADPIALSMVYEQRTALAVARGDLAAAAAMAGRGLSLAARAYAQPAAGGADRPRANVVRTYARALAQAGQVAAARGHAADADAWFEAALAALAGAEYGETATEIRGRYAATLAARGAYAAAGTQYRLALRAVARLPHEAVAADAGSA